VILIFQSRKTTHKEEMNDIYLFKKFDFCKGIPWENQAF